MKNGQIPDHWQLWLWIGIAALILAALARQSAIDTGGMSTFNANLVFGGIIALFGLLYLALHEFLTKKFGTLIVSGLESFFRWLGLKEGQPLQETAEPEPIPLTTEPIQQLAQPIEPPSPTETIESGIVKIETPTPKKIVIDYEGRREAAKRKQEEKAYKKEENVILYIGYTLSPLMDSKVVEKIINAVTEFIHAEGVPSFSEKDEIDLPDELTTTDMMHFGWNVAKPFKKYNLHTAYFLKQVFAQKFKDVEVCTIERKLPCHANQGIIKLDKDVEHFEIPTEDEEVNESTDTTTSKKTASKKATKTKSESKATEKKSKSTKSSKKSNSAMAAAFADMGLEPYCPGDNVLDVDDYNGSMW